MTENTTQQTRTEMKAVDHTHPDTDRPFGEAVVFERGPTVAADGGTRTTEDEHRTVEEEEADRDTDEEQMKDVDHEPPDETESNRVFERGREGRDDTR
jgi:hypothetical protein